MHKQSRLKHVKRSLGGPPRQPLPVYTTVARPRRAWLGAVGSPAVRDEPYVAVARRKLPERADAVFWVGP